MTSIKNKEKPVITNASKENNFLDYRSTTMPIWCPGCGDYAVAHGLTAAFATLKIKQENIAIASGIGCAGRFPCFINCYGFHGLHGRSLPIATGMKLGNDSLTVLAIGGDGDGLCIGGGHLAHVARNNVDITYLMLDNSIYGLTKGQTSPTADQGTVSKTTPQGSAGLPLDPVLLFLSYNAAFVSRAFAGQPEEMADVIEKAIRHKGFSFVHILSPCVVFNKSKTYDFYYDICKRFPSNYKADSREKAMKYALDEKHYYTGVYYNQPRATF